MKDQEKLPDLLQFLPPTKIREPDAKIRLTHIETLLLLCHTRWGRDYQRQNGVYQVIRATHEHESVDKVCQIFSHSATVFWPTNFSLDLRAYRTIGAADSCWRAKDNRRRRRVWRADHRAGNTDWIRCKRLDSVGGGFRRWRYAHRGDLIHNDFISAQRSYTKICYCCSIVQLQSRTQTGNRKRCTN